MIKRYKIKKSRRINRGFTLVETLVAISIFTMSIVALLIIITQSISDTNYTKKKMTATYLTQEGIEYVRNMRDTLVLYNAVSSQAGWNAFKAKLASCNPANGCGFDTVFSQNVFICNNPNDCKLYVNNGNYSSDSSGADSGFIRKIWMTTVPANPDEVKIFSAVFWTQGSGNYDVVFAESLFNWIE